MLVYSANDAFYGQNFNIMTVFCIVPPSPPRNLSIVDRTESSITVAWDPPMRQAGTCNVTYGVYTAINGGPRVKSHLVNETNAVILGKFILKQPCRHSTQLISVYYY